MEIGQICFSDQLLDILNCYCNNKQIQDTLHLNATIKSYLYYIY